MICQVNRDIDMHGLLYDRKINVNLSVDGAKLDVEWKAEVRKRNEVNAARDAARAITHHSS